MLTRVCSAVRHDLNPHPGSLRHECNRVLATGLEAIPEPARRRRLEPGFQNLVTPHTSQCLLLRDAGERDLFSRCLRDAALESTWVPQLHRLWQECRAGGFCLDGPGREPFGHLCPSFDFFVHCAVGWLAAVLALTKIYYGGKAMVVLLALVAATAVYFTWYDRPRDQVRMTGPDDIPRWHWWVTWVLMPVVAVWVFLINLHPRVLDLFHHGEVITSALDLLDGGVPFRTYHWPHGLSDSGVAALLIELTGNKGLGTIILLGGITCVLGLAAVFLLGLGMLRQPLGALVFAALVALLPGWLIGVASGRLIGGGWLRLLPDPVVLLAQHTLCQEHGFGGRRSDWTGLPLASRPEVFALATVVVYLLLKFYYTERYARDGHVWQHLLDPHAAARFFGDGLALLLGVTCSLVLMRLTLGFPTADGSGRPWSIHRITTPIRPGSRSRCTGRGWDLVTVSDKVIAMI